MTLHSWHLHPWWQPGALFREGVSRGLYRAGPEEACVPCPCAWHLPKYRPRSTVPSPSPVPEVLLSRKISSFLWVNAEQQWAEGRHKAQITAVRMVAWAPSSPWMTGLHALCLRPPRERELEGAWAALRLLRGCCWPGLGCGDLGGTQQWAVSSFAWPSRWATPGQYGHDKIEPVQANRGCSG